ncbi:MAG: TldD/PmbA family protein [Candidatus Nanohaloarchaea archaeon]|nr:TldD/PmbA family protein [Candidatus Nanohaloarchaea archaeon]
MFDAMQKAFDVTGYDQLEVYAEREKAIECSVLQDRVDSVESETSHGIGVRALVDNKVGFSYTTDPERVQEAAQRAVKLARLSQFETISFPVQDTFPEVEGVHDRETAALDQEDITAMTRDAIDTDSARFTGGKTSRVVGETYVMNSTGLQHSQEETYFVSYLTANRDGRSKYWFETSRSVMQVSDIASKAIDVLDRYGETTTVDSEAVDVVLTPQAQYQIFSGLLYPAFNADRVQRGKSALADEQGNTVAADHVTIRDDGLKQGGINTRPFDREGTPAQETALINEGVLEQVLYDVQRAEKDSVSSTGNASGGYSSFPSISPTNMVVEMEEEDEDALDDAVVIYDVAGVHTANETSGDFSLDITTGFYREGGEEKAIENGLFVGNIFDLLENASFMYGEPRMVDSLTSRPAVFTDQRVVH